MRSSLLFLVLAIGLGLGSHAQGPGQVAQHIQALQGAGKPFPSASLFEMEQPTPSSDLLWQSALTRADVLRLDAARIPLLTAMAGTTVAMELPSQEGTLILDLERVDIVTDEFKVVTSSGEEIHGAPGLHYRGMIRGRAGSLAAISVFGDEVMGLLADEQGQLVLGRLENDIQGRHVLYRDSDLLGAHGAVCATPDGGPDYTPTQMRSEGVPKTLRCVRFFWEVNYNIVQNKGSVANATNYVTGLFNQTAILFANDGIDVVLNELFVWNSASPYTANSSFGRLEQFGDHRTSFNGDLAHLIDISNYGGVAWLNTLCASPARYRMAYSGISASYQNVPTYSWSVEVVTHEQGHNMGSQHTHACAWNGNNTAIDGCGQVAGYSEGGCLTGPIPPSNVGGTIMSYCHLTSSTINFANGFGPQPTAVIVNAVNGASCLPTCGTSCGPPPGLTASNIGTTTATLVWASTGADTYSIRRRLSPNGSWTTTNGLASPTHAYTGLATGTTYDVQVRSVCSGQNSNWTSTYTFTTLVPCPDALEPNNSTGAAAPIALPASINAQIASSSDVDYYSFTLDQTANIVMSLSNLPADYDLRLLNAGGGQLAISQNGGTNSESINYANAPSGTYYAHVYGYQGASSNTQCYLLTVNATGAQGCGVPTGLNASNILYNGATIGWSPMQAATGYDLQWRTVGAPAWTDVSNITGTSHVLTGLAWSTLHECRVRTRCAGGNSLYGPPIQFTTLDPPCEVVPKVNVRPKALLDGPYQGSGLMSDGLRTQGLIPLQEPYSAMGWPVSGATSISAGVLATTGVNAIVDWVVVELRSNTSPWGVLERKAALLQRDGDVVGLDGTSPVGFCVNPGTYRVAIRHRNHLGAMTGQGYALSANAVTVDLTQSATTTWGTGARKTSGSVMLLWAGNALTDQILRYTGQFNDRDIILQLIGGTVPSNTVSGYHLADITMDGLVKYTGPGNDRDPILSNVGGSLPTNTLVEQMP